MGINITKRLNRAFRLLHRWGGIVCAIPLLVVILTGLLLQVKKNVLWVQPPTKIGFQKNSTPTQTWGNILDIVRGIEEAGVDEWDDIDRLDMRPSKGIVKVRCQNRWEVQIDLSSGDVLSSTHRRTDFIESLHDGTFFPDFAKLWIFLPAGILLLLLWVTGLWLWALPWQKRLGTKPANRG